MLEYAGSQRAGRRERDSLHLVAVVRSFDWILVIGLAALLVVGLWGIGGVTSHDAAGPHYYLDRQILSPETVLQRFHYKRPELFAMEVTCISLPTPFTLHETPDMAGCHSWVELPEGYTVPSGGQSHSRPAPAAMRPAR